MFEHFIAAQEGVYPHVLDELRAGRKQSHWMWFIFPQLAALGRSAAAQRYGIADLPAAQVYAAHALLGARLRECVTLVNAIEARTAIDIFATPDDLKFRSCATLFLRATGEPLFRAALDKYYSGAEDPLTLQHL